MSGVSESHPLKVPSFEDLEAHRFEGSEGFFSSNRRRLNDQANGNSVNNSFESSGAMKIHVFIFESSFDLIIF